MNLKSELINIVLVETSHPGNIGSVARAMKTMGLSKLSLINPRKFPSGEANALSGNATDILENAQVYKTIEDAIKTSTFVYATSSRNRTIQWPTVNVEEGAELILNQTTAKKEISILFGREDRGLTNSELLFAHKIFNINTSQNYPSLNLSHAVAIILYELNKCSINNPNNDLQTFNLASSKQIYESFKEIEEMLIRTGYLLEHTANSKISKFKKFLLKAKTSSHDIDVLRGIVHQINWFLNHSKGK